jgi:hypothetical protein
MANESKHASDYTLAQLQLNVQKSETIRQSATSIAATKNQYARFTKVEHDFSKPAKTGSLRISLDPDGTAAPPAGQTLVCRGTAWVQEEEKKVALFRTA